MRKKALILVLALLLALSALPTAAHAQAGGVSMTVTVGYGGKYVVGKIAPVTVTVKNDGGEIAGTLELRTGTGFSLVVRREVVLPPATQKEFVLFVMASNIYKPSDFEVRLVSSGRTILSATPASVMGVDPGKSLCAIVSGDPSSVAYLKKIVFDATSIKDWVDMNPAAVYDNSQLLESFSLIAINGVAPQALTDKQYDALSQWVYSGGTLLIGTGPGGEPAPQWKELTEGLTFGGQTTAAGFGRLATLASGQELQASLPILDMKGDGWVASAQTDDGKALVLSRRLGRGSVYVASYDLGEGAMSGWTGASLIWQGMLANGAYAGSQNGKMSYGYYSGYGYNSGMQSLLQQGYAGGGVTFALFLAILGVFVVASGIVSYLVLKALDRQKLMWVAIPALSVLFSAALLVCGSTSFGRKPYLAAFTTTDLSGNVSRSTNTVGLIAPAFGRYRVAAQGASLLYPVDQNDANYNYNSMIGTGNTAVKQDVTAITDAGAGDIEFPNVNLNGTRMLSFESFDRKAALSYTVEYNGSAVICKVRNASDWTIEGVAAVVGDTCQSIGELAPGQEKEVSLPLDQTSFDQAIWSVIDQLFPVNYGGGGMFQIANPKQTEQTVRASLLRQQADQLITGMISTGADELGRALLLGWVKRPLPYAVTVNGSTTKPESLELLTAISPIKSKAGTGVEVRRATLTSATAQPGGASGVNLSGATLNLDPGSNALLVFSFSDFAGISVSDLSLDMGSVKGQSSGTWSIFNWTTNAWDAVASGQHFTGNAIAQYINADGTVRMTASVGQNDYYSGTPYLLAQGVKK